MKRDWKEFYQYSKKSVSCAIWPPFLVPIFFVLLNPHFHQPHYFQSLLMSMRIAFQITSFHWLASILIFAGIFCFSPSLLVTFKKSVKYQIAHGLSLMIIGLALCSWIEPKISGSSFGIGDASVGLLVGGVTFLVFVFYAAYKHTHEHNLVLATHNAQNELHVLKNQMQPHFLFNSLNTLAEMIETKKEDTAEVVHELSDLYRELLENSKQALCTLESELKIIEKYLSLEKRRMRDRLHFQIQHPENEEKIYIPSLLLQTLVENAIKHSISKSINGGYLEVNFQNLETGYRAHVKNSGAFQNKKTDKGTGLANSEKRLKLLYGEKAKFEIQSINHETIVSFYFSGNNNE